MIACFEKENLKNTIIAGILLLVATFFVTVGVAEISFPETILTFTDQEWLLDIWPKAYRYNIHVGVGAIVLACALIFPAIKIQKDFATRTLETLCRIGIGGMFIFASIFKIQDPHQFATLVAQYQFFSALHLDFVNNFFALVYPQFEFWFGLAMIVSPFVRESAFAIFWMFVSFIIALAWALWNDLGITCGCFELEGAQDKAEAWTSLIRDLILIWPTLWLAFRKNKSIIGIWKKDKEMK
ncbi:MAG: MauE/DoxX family redox-associated membrane protein [Fibrobacter sp.]|nr:MauE/DoxX family redox-associated membrane protein [Fibrobacter sp.]